MTDLFSGKQISGELQQKIGYTWQRYLESCEEHSTPVCQHEKFIATVATVWSASEFCSDTLIQNPIEFEDFFVKNILVQYSENNYWVALTQKIKAIESEIELMSLLRKFRNMEILRIIWRELNDWSSLTESLRDLSNLADACIALTLDKLYQWQCVRYGIPESYKGKPQTLQVIALGKLGGQELNLSSDVDLIFCYPSRGKTDHKKAEAHETFFLRLARSLIRVLDTQTADGFVFRVDMRLRPFGQHGALVLDFKALEYYCQSQGRTWERFAYLKARVITGHFEEVKHLEKVIRGFVYRSYVDFGVIEDLRELKLRINREITQQNLADNIKRGPGGIREIEFIVYAMQLIRGGKDRQLQSDNLLTTLKKLKKFSLLPEDTIIDLNEAYIFLRRVEHCLQAYRDLQTQELPTDTLQQLRLTLAMGFSSYQDFTEKLTETRQKVKAHFDDMISVSQSHNPQADQYPAKDIQLMFEDAISHKDALEVLLQNGFVDVDAVYGLVSKIKTHRRFQRMTVIGQTRLEKLLPIFIYKIGQSKHPDTTLVRLIKIIEAIMQRSAYLALLYENPAALDQLIYLCDRSSWIAEQLARYPVLLDDLLDPRLLQRNFSLQDLQDEIEQQLLSIPQENLEQQLECLSQFKMSHVLRIAARDITDNLSIVEVSNSLSDIASIILQQIKVIAWRKVCARYGCLVDAQHNEHDINEHFAILAYGKLAGNELGYDSDLDLVFLYKDENQQDNVKYYLKLAQSIISLLQTHTFNGILYQIDTRLRPSGESGLLVTSITAFAHYQSHKAWIWEHQALIRSRVVSGSLQLQQEIKQIRQRVLTVPRQQLGLQQEILVMRKRIADARKSTDKTAFHLKYDKGGITDIEFIVQYAVLLWSSAHHCLLDYPDNIRILQVLAEEKLLSQDVATTLSLAYQKYRRALHHLNLKQEKKQTVNASKFSAEQEAVTKIWQQLLETTH